jgi:hypothetical protein
MLAQERGEGRPRGGNAGAREGGGQAACQVGPRGRGAPGGPPEGEKGERKGLVFFFLFSLFNLFSNLCFSSSSSPKCMFHKFTQQTKYMHGTT